MPDRDSIIQVNWPKIKAGLEKQLKSANKYTTVLYNVQVWTNLILEYSFRRNDLNLLDQLAELYMLPLQQIKETESYWFYKGGRTGHGGYVKLSLPSATRMWTVDIKQKTGKIQLEMVLHSSQFLFLVSNAIHCFVSIASEQRTVHMHRLIREYAPIALQHYRRWVFSDNGSTNGGDSLGVFQTRGWGCSEGRYNHQQFLQKKLARQFGDLNPISYCNAVLDKDMWILCGSVQLLAAHKKDPQLFFMDSAEKERFASYFALGCQLLEERLEKTTLTDFQGKTVHGYNFDPGAWNQHKDMRYAGYNLGHFPESKHSVPGVPVNPESFPLPANLSWDISHARRFVQVFETLYRNRPITGQWFPSKEVMTGLANQVTYALFNRNFKRPLFVNFFNGSNGWYRVNYKKKGGGFGTSDFSVEWLSGGMASWYHYQPDLKQVCDALWDMIESKNEAVKAFRGKRYEHASYLHCRRRKNKFLNPGTYPYLLNFIASSFMPGLADPPPPDHEIQVEPLDNPELIVNRQFLRFGARKGGLFTLSQPFTVSHKAGDHDLSWTISPNAAWLKCTPSSGKGSREITVSVDPGNLPSGAINGTIIVKSLENENITHSISVKLKIFRSKRKFLPGGSFDTPHDNAEVSGSLVISGWALDRLGIEKVEIFRSPVKGEGRRLVYIGNAVFSADTRPDVATMFPNYPNYFRAGWGYSLLTNLLPNSGNGQFKLHAFATNVSGDSKKLGVKSIICNNVDAKNPFGALDAPEPGAMVSGTIRVSGWVLTPPPAKIPGNGSTIQMVVDGKVVQHAHYDVPRQDIADLFPHCLNAKQSLTFYDLDTTQYPDGVHSLELSVTDNAGHHAIIGSRYIKIQNQTN